jgi:biotin carboxyl carrier protein
VARADLSGVQQLLAILSSTSSSANSTTQRRGRVKPNAQLAAPGKAAAARQQQQRQQRSPAAAAAGAAAAARAANAPGSSTSSASASATGDGQVRVCSRCVGSAVCVAVHAGNAACDVCVCVSEGGGEEGAWWLHGNARGTHEASKFGAVTMAARQAGASNLRGGQQQGSGGGGGQGGGGKKKKHKKRK